MSEIHYNIIFDVTQAGYRQWQELYLAIIFGAIPIIIISFKGIAWLRHSIYAIKFLLFACVFICLMGAFGFQHSYSNYLRLQSAMRDSKCIITEGVVTQFHKTFAGRNSNRPAETFVVNNVEFRYADGSAQNGFHQIGIITNGMQVRIYHFDGIDSVDKDITRLEIAQ
jgi:hypothetical protein